MVEIGHGATDRKVTYPTQFRFHLARRNKSPGMCVCSLPASDLSFLLGSISQDERTATRHGCPTAVENACDFNGSWVALAIAPQAARDLHYARAVPSK